MTVSAHDLLEVELLRELVDSLILVTFGVLCDKIVLVSAPIVVAQRLSKDDVVCLTGGGPAVLGTICFLRVEVGEDANNFRACETAKPKGFLVTGVTASGAF